MAPVSRDPNGWLHWAPTPGAGFWIRPRQVDPILRDRFILVEPAALNGAERPQTISRHGLRDASQFALESGRLVWHNPPKGGARAPESAHVQSMPSAWQNGATRHAVSVQPLAQNCQFDQGKSSPIG